MKIYPKWNFKNPKRKFFLVAFMVIGGALIYSAPVMAQFPCGPTSSTPTNCTTTADCLDPFNNDLCPPCVECVAGVCQPIDTNCDDSNDCTEDACVLDVGCQNIPIALQDNPDLPIECYICEPTANNLTIDNGVCDSGLGEDCSNSPDCEVPGETCGTPPPAPGTCDHLNPELACPDGDRCTLDECVGNDTCVNSPKTCEPNFQDGCCPEDPSTGQPCEGPGVGGQCSPNDLGCDPDCWPPQDCGDGVVQAPETCDASADAGNAGLQPNGQPVLDSQCRQQGTQFECTYCGDGIVQSPLEQCELNELGACGGAGCGINCLCQADICLEGSGDIVGGEGNAAAPLPAFCDTCSLNINAPHGGIMGWALGIGFMLLPGGFQWIRRRMS